MSDTSSVATYIDAETRVLSAPNGVDYAYRATGSSDAPPLVTLQHQRRRTFADLAIGKVDPVRSA